MKGAALVVEDDASLAELLRWHLERNGFGVRTTPDGEEALLLAKEDAPDVIILDWMIEGIPGIEVCRRLRRTPGVAHVPIIMITGRSEEADRIRGLETGADDYLTKPFSPQELIARIGAVMRRARPAMVAEQLRFADLEMDLTRHRVRRGSRNIALGPTEFRLLRHLIENPGRVYSRERLLDAVWGHDRDIEPRTVDVHIRRLRKAINMEGRPELIRTVRSAGYALDEDAG